MFESIFTIDIRTAIPSEGDSRIRKAKRRIHAIDEGTPHAAFLLVDNVPTLAIYDHWRHVKVRESRDEYGMRSQFIDLGKVNSVQDDGRGMLVIKGEPGFMRACDFRERGSGIASEDDPTAGYDKSKVADNTETRIRDCYEPSLMATLSQYLASRGENSRYNSSAVRRKTLLVDGELEKSLLAWHEAQQTEESVAARRKEKAADVAIGALILVIVTWTMIILVDSSMSLSLVQSSLGGILVLLTGIIIGIILGFKASIDGMKDVLDRTHLLRVGTASIVTENHDRFLLVRQNPTPIFVGDGKTHYWMVALDDADTTVSYDEDSHLVTFSGSGIWHTSSCRYAAEDEVIPSRDSSAMEPVNSYRIADCFEPPLMECLPSDMFES